MKSLSLYVLLCVALLGMLCGCGGSDHTSLPSTNGPVTSSTRTFNNLEFTLSTPKSTYAVGEPVPMTLTVKNVGTQVITAFGDGCASFFSVSQGTQVIGPQGGPCKANGYALELNPGETRTFQPAWTQLTVDGQSVGTGQYTLKSWITTSKINGMDVLKNDFATSLASNPITISIVADSTGAVTSTPRTYDGLEFVLSTPKSTYAVGETVPLALVVKNKGTQTANLYLGSFKASTFEIDRNGAFVWDDSFGIAVGSTETLAAGETKTYTYDWPEDIGSNADKRGQYSIFAYYQAFQLNGVELPEGPASTKFASNPITITIAGQ